MKDGFGGYNLYAYCNNNPVLYADPTGHSIILACVIIGAIIGGAVGGYLASNSSKEKTGSVKTGDVVGGVIGGAVVGGVAGLGAGALVSTIGAYATGTLTTTAASAADKAARSTSTAVQTYYPPNNGFMGATQNVTLNAGTMLQRTGSLYGSFVAPAGTPQQMLSLPYDKIGQATTILQVQKPIQAIGGRVAPWFGQMGGGTQYLLNSSVQKMISEGVLKIME